MVFLGAPLRLRNRLAGRCWRIQEVLKHARHFRGRRNRCYTLAVRAVIRAFVKGTAARRQKKRDMRTIRTEVALPPRTPSVSLCTYCEQRPLWINRITAASQEHGLKYPAFIANLVKCQVELNRKVLADLAIYEPKTFKSLAALAKRRREEGFAAALGDGKEPEGIFSRVVQYH
ncbi:large ribosomal subunit protein bL20m isoform X1 [Cynocephalus volans]|uniref:large ribosomal subunit protein bL20m isoform X1 n=1 Tax=Cynocephalus volans TaxID=110931 RepID=UPI002FC5D27E